MSLPSGAIRLNWIQSTGTQYVDTGLLNKPGYTINTRFKIPSGVSSCDVMIAGGRTYDSTATNARLYYISIYNSQWVIAYADVGLVSGHTVLDNTIYDVSSTLAVGKQTVVVNGETIYETASTATFNSTRNVELMGASHYTAVGRVVMYSCQIYDNGVIVRDYIPCKLADGTVGLWDDANEQFYGNAGSGVFVAGPASEIVELEYIQSSGTQYIDAAFNPNSNTRIVADMDVNFSATLGQVPFGARGSVDGLYFYPINNETWTYVYNNTLAVSSDKSTGRIVLDANKNVLSVNGKTVASVASANFTVPVPVFLFSLNSAGSAVANITAKLYASQMYDNGLLVRDYVPAKTIEGEVGLYDRVFHEFYRNAGTGVFIAGPVVVKVPEAPANFRRVSSTSTTVTLAWDAAETATGYRLYRDGVLVADVTGTQFTDAIETNVTYSYTLTAYNENGESEAAALSVYVEPPPGPPENFRQTGQSLTTISLAWDAVADADTYYLYRNGTLVGVTDATAFTDTGLKRGVEYTYGVSAAKNGAIGDAATILAGTQYELGLVTDRTQEDVAARNEKGVYGVADLNRVGDAMNYIAGVFTEQGYIVEISPRTDWKESEWPTPASMAHYLDCLATLRSMIAVYKNTPLAPGSMEKLRYSTANEIEMILVDIDWLLNHIYAAYRHCGVTICGEGGLIL